MADGKTPPEQKPDEKKAKQYFLVVLNDEEDGAPRCIACATEADFAEAIEQNVLSAKKEIYAFAFEGERIPIGAPRPVCTLTVGGKSRQIGRPTSEFDEAGRIVPLVVPGPILPSDA